ncbi:MAG: hypothetical protein EOO26_01145 [Comamonadaceae bacterium]|nr:MAG: hypothetical protein EOO26_01145 [Comamonadaceae bacterium]
METPAPLSALLGNLPAWWWALLGLCLAAFALLRSFVRERPNAARERALRAIAEQCGRAESAVEQASLDNLRDAPRAAHQRATRGPAGLRGIYRTPWYLFVGDSASGVPRLLAAASGESASIDDGGIWHWTALDSMVAIAAAPAIVEAPDAPRTRRAWYHALLALAQERGRLPINGIVVCVDARRLQQERAVVAGEAARLRRCVDHVASQLRLRLPIHVVVTGLEALASFATVQAILPDAVRAQAIGHRLHNDRRSTADAVIDALFLRLYMLRMALLRSHPATADRLAIHDFIEALRGTEAGLRVLASELFGPHGGAVPAQPCRGLFLCATNDPGGTFVRDVFERFLPADQPLARAA